MQTLCFVHAGFLASSVNGVTKTFENCSFLVDDQTFELSRVSGICELAIIDLRNLKIKTLAADVFIDLSNPST